jgi:hydroxymethylbilane synthase
MSGRILKVGTRGSRLAREQTRRLCQVLDEPFETVIVKTSGDRHGDVPLGEQQGIGFFTKEIENELLSGQIDLAVHSLKDLPTTLASGLVLGALLERDEAGDVLLVQPDAHAPDRVLPLRPGSRVGASAMRRQALLASLASDLVPVPIRGNVPTRVDKARRGDYDAVILSRAGLARLKLDVAPLLAFDLNPEHWICAPGQGVIAVEARADDQHVLQSLTAADDQMTRDCTGAERSLLVTFGGGCHAPFGAWARPQSGGFQLRVAAPGKDGRCRLALFEAVDLKSARQQADEWILAGRPMRENKEECRWLCRPARPWC